MTTKKVVKKTIRMPKATLRKWLKALRSGEYKQAGGALFDEEKVGYCCLGVLQHCLDGGVEYIKKGCPCTVPSFAWLEDEGIRFTNFCNNKAVVPELPTLGTDAATANDGDQGVRPKSFKTIANAIEACTETY